MDMLLETAGGRKTLLKSHIVGCIVSLETMGHYSF